MPIDWDLIVEDGSETTSLRHFVQDQYPYHSDASISRILRRNGFDVSTQAVKSLRTRAGWTKKAGVATIYEEKDIRKEEDITLTRLTTSEVLQTQGISTDVLLETLKDQPRTIQYLSAKFDRSEKTVRYAIDDLRAAHYNIVEVTDKILLNTQSPPKDTTYLPRTLADQAGMRVRMNWIADIHAGSTAQQITDLNGFLELSYDRGVRHTLIAGDLFAGHNVYRGQIHDLFAYGADKQLTVLRTTLSKLPGMIYYVIGGNHDYSFIKASGYNIVADFAATRDDVIYLGYDMADVPLTDRVDIRMWHPHGGVPYAVSYRLQKGLEQMVIDELSSAVETRDNPKLRGVASGHLHIDMTMHRGPIFGAQVGCFEGQTNYLKRRAIFPQIGGYIIEWKLTDSGLIQECSPNFVSFLEIQDDYKNYPAMLAEISDRWEDTPGCLFTWIPNEE